MRFGFKVLARALPVSPWCTWRLHRSQPLRGPFRCLLSEPVRGKSVLQHWLCSGDVATLLNILFCLVQKTVLIVFKEISYILEHLCICALKYGEYFCKINFVLFLCLPNTVWGEPYESVVIRNVNLILLIFKQKCIYLESLRVTRVHMHTHTGTHAFL